jgi:hypothetical protein
VPVAMNAGATTPEELETLLEDAFVNRDRDLVVDLFENWGVLAGSCVGAEARGHEQIGLAAVSLWSARLPYVADPVRIVQAPQMALMLGSHGVNVAMRGLDGAWRYAITLLTRSNPTTKESHEYDICSPELDHPGR